MGAGKIREIQGNARYIPFFPLPLRKKFAPGPPPLPDYKHPGLYGSGGISGKQELSYANLPDRRFPFSVLQAAEKEGSVVRMKETVHGFPGEKRGKKGG